MALTSNTYRLYKHIEDGIPLYFLVVDTDLTAYDSLKGTDYLQIPVVDEFTQQIIAVSGELSQTNHMIINGEHITTAYSTNNVLTLYLDGSIIATYSMSSSATTCALMPIILRDVSTGELKSPYMRLYTNPDTPNKAEIYLTYFKTISKYPKVGASGYVDSNVVYTQVGANKVASNNFRIQGGRAGIVTDNKAYYNYVVGGTLIDKNDPNSKQPDSTTSGGGGTNDIGGATNDDDGLPTVDAIDSGLLTAYNPTVAELQSLGKFLWSDSFDLNNFKKLFNDPFDTLLGLSIVPIAPKVSGARNIMFGNLDSGVSANVLSSQWTEFNCGSVVLNEVWHGALDYSPFTSCSIYLPFIGMRQLNINDVMGSTLKLLYKFDVLTGTCIAQIYVNHDHRGNDSDDKGFSYTRNQGLVYEFIGQCATNIPLASQDYTNTIRSAISAVGMVAGASASIATGNPALGVATAMMGTANTSIQANTPTVERSGHLSGSSAILGYTKPFLVVERPHQVKPSQSYRLRGFPSQIGYDALSDVHGYTEIADANNLHASGATESELKELKQLLMQGVYLP